VPISITILMTNDQSRFQAYSGTPPPLLTGQSWPSRESIFASWTTLPRRSDRSANRQLHRCRFYRLVCLRSTRDLDIARALVVVMVIVVAGVLLPVPVVVRLPVSLPVLPERPAGYCLVVSLSGATGTLRHRRHDDSRQSDKSH